MIYELSDHCIQRCKLHYRIARWFVVNETGMAVDVFNHKENADSLAEKSAGTLRVVKGTQYKLDKMVSEST